MSNNQGKNILAELYLSGLSIKAVAEHTGQSEWTVRQTIKVMGIVRKRSKAISIGKRQSQPKLSYQDLLERKEAAPLFKAMHMLNSHYRDKQASL
ncbi:hypothetical protein [Shewanella sp. MBTL60-007]|uniref:hypothetical protein n=1 Tax=Shewanella sp. MBTL60-007 TaxID=2815911 RepID=UPI001BBF3B57|nr:hypothetical protein [Shewanella sp. MBTL60-007]GIU22080.1 hypothetical protein TUM3792_23710 [Shewanella sp. MBTL60-007]